MSYTGGVNGGQSVSFDGVDDYIDLSIIDRSNLTNTSISFWYKNIP